MKHTQHTKLPKPERGYFGKNEISILGSNCHQIQTIAQIIGDIFKDEFQVAWIDADHRAEKEEAHPAQPVFARALTNKISHYQHNLYAQSHAFETNAFLNSAHLVLVNGNHDKANHQIVIMDPNKESSLRKRKEALTGVIALIKPGNENEAEGVPDHIRELIPNYHDLPVIAANDRTGIKELICSFMEKRTPEIKGLILGGGKSTRMGTDKALLDYHGVPQFVYLQDELASICTETYVSCRYDQQELFSKPLPDTFLNLGAYSGILSAFQKEPNAAWLIVACDVPLLKKDILEILVKERDPSKIATCFYNSETGFPEPLITLWEPRAYPVLLHYLSQGYSCPRKVLINNEVKVVTLANEAVLLNANTKEERAKALSMLQQGNS